MFNDAFELATSVHWYGSHVAPVLDDLVALHVELHMNLHMVLHNAYTNDYAWGNGVVSISSRRLNYLLVYIQALKMT